MQEKKTGQEKFALYGLAEFRGKQILKGV